MESDGPAQVVMSHRRSNSLTGSAKVSDIHVPSQARTQPLHKASSLDVGGHGSNVAAGPSHDCDESGRRGRPDNLAQAAIHVAQSAYEALENRSEAIFQRFDDGLDELERGPFVQTAKATVQRAATVIEEPVERIRRSKLVEEVSYVLREVENTEVVQAARGRARNVYHYVEPIGEKILSRVGSLDTEEEEVQFVIPPQMQRPSGRVLPATPKPVARVSDEEGTPVRLDPVQYGAIQEEVPEINVLGEDGCSVLSHGSDNLLKVKAPDQLSIVSETDSVRHYEIVRPYKLYRTPPLPPPKPREHRRSLQVRLSNSGIKTLLLEEKSEKSRLLEKSNNCECSGASGQRSVRFSEGKPSENSAGESGGPNSKGADPTKLGVRTVIDIKERRPALKDIKAQESIDKKNSALDECGEEEPLVPVTDLEGHAIAKIREKLKETDCNIVVLNGKTFFVPKSALKEPEKREVYGGASAFFEASQEIDWSTVKGIHFP